MLSKRKMLVLFACPLLVTGCGEGYELIKTDSYFPYGNERTAGSGYAYVLAKMLPEKDVKLESVKRDWQPEAVEKEMEEVIEPVAAVEPQPEPEPVVEAPEGALEEPEPIKEADELFLDDGIK